MKVRSASIKGVIGAIAMSMFGIYPSVVEAIPQPARRACMVRTAEEMLEPVSNVKIINVGNVNAENGAVTVVLENTRTKETASCRVNTIDNSVSSVIVNTGSSPSNPGITNSGQNPEFFIVTANKTFLKATPGIFAGTVNNNITKNTVLRNLGCQKPQFPTWCQVEVRDNPRIKGWAFSPNFKEYRASRPRPEPSQQASPQVGTTVARLSDLVGARAGQAENTIKQRGYRFLRTEISGDAPYSYWREPRTNYCVVIRTSNGRYESIVYDPTSCDQASTPTPSQQAAPAAGTTVSGLSDLVDARAGQAENTVINRGYKFIKAAGDGYTYWRENRTGFCVSVRTENGRYASFVYATAIDCQ